MDGNTFFNIIGLILCFLFLLRFVVAPYLIYKSAQRRGKSGTLYVLICLFIPFGLIISIIFIFFYDSSDNQPQPISYTESSRTYQPQPQRRQPTVATCSYCGCDVPYRHNPFVRDIVVCQACRYRGHIKYINGKAILEW